MIDKKNKMACFTGHRAIKGVELSHIRKKVSETVAELIGQGISVFLSGGALGFDTITAQAVLQARAENANVKLIMVLPCDNQDSHWREEERRTYRSLLDNADKIIYVSEQPYSNGCMKKRNLFLVEHSSVCVAYMKRGRSGASQTIRMAREHGLTVINLAEK